MSRSSSDDVLDNWEEIDEAGLSNQLHQIKRDMGSGTEISPSQNGLSQMMIPPDDDYGSSYTQPAKPAVKILRRPSQQSKEQKANDLKPKQPIKTLQQREQEYAEARLRIMGSAKNPEDELETSFSKVATNSLEVSDDNCQDTRICDTIPCNTSLNGQMRPYDHVIRMPRGPDGTSGFNIRR